MTDLVMNSAATLGIALLVLWLISIATGKVSFIDSFWATGFIVVIGTAALQVTELGQQQAIALILLSLWGLRLSVYLLHRFLSHGEDARYIRMTKDKSGIARHVFTLWFVFGLQGALILIISAPLLALFGSPPADLTALSYIGIAIWALGAFFEWVGDWQLSRFKANPENEGKVLDHGLWGLTRHPNYFGDACVWWGLWLIGHDITTIFAPLLMTFLLMKWSGVPLLEKSMRKRRPDYADYCERTSTFFPWPQKN